MQNPTRKCSKCPSYSRALGRCKNGKINPKTIKGGVEAAKLFGLSYICTYAKLQPQIFDRLTKEGAIY